METYKNLRLMVKPFENRMKIWPSYHRIASKLFSILKLLLRAFQMLHCESFASKQTATKTLEFVCGPYHNRPLG